MTFQQRLQPLDAAVDARIGDMLIRAGFANPAVYKVFEDGARAKLDASAMAAADVRAVEVAERAQSIDVAALPGYLDDVSAALDGRDAVTGGTPAAEVP